MNGVQHVPIGRGTLAGVFPSIRKPLLGFLIALPLLLAVWMWQVAQKRPHLLPGLPVPVASLALSADGTRLAVGSPSGQVVLWTQNDGKWRVLPFAGAANAGPTGSCPPDLQFSPDARSLLGTNQCVTNQSTSIASAWNTASLTPAWSAVTPFKDDMNHFWPSLDATRMAQRSYDVVKVLDLSKAGAPLASPKSRFARDFPVLLRFRERRGVRPFTFQVAVSPDNAQVIVAESAGNLEFRSIASGKITLRTPVPPNSSGVTGTISALSPSPDGRFVALCDSYRVFLWDMKSGSWTQHASISSSPHSIAWMPDSRSLWVGGANIERLSAPTLQSLRTLPIGGPFAVSADGRTLVTSTFSGDGVWQWKIG